MARRLLTQTAQELKDRAQRYGLSVDVIAAAVGMRRHEVGAALAGQQEIPLRLRVFLSLYGGTSRDARAAVVRAVAESAGIADREWRPVPGFSNYEVSNRGEVQRNGLLLNPVTQKFGHKKVSLYNGTKRGVTFGVHVLVALAFNGLPPPGKTLACHINGCADDNRPENLYWGDSFDNARDTVKHAKQRHVDVEGTWTIRGEKDTLTKRENKLKMLQRLRR